MKLVDILEVLKNDEFEKVERHESFSPSVVYDVITNNEGKIRLAYHPYLFKKGGEYHILLFVPEEDKSIQDWWVNPKREHFDEVEDLYQKVKNQFKNQYAKYFE